MPAAGALALAALLSACAHAPLGRASAAVQTVEAEGWAVYDAKDPIAARERALADAQKRAVEKVAGVYVSARTDVRNDVRVDSRIRALMDGTIASYEVLGERQEEGFLKIQIRAKVVEKDPTQLGETKHSLRVRVEIAEANLADAVCQALREAGFPVSAASEGTADVVVSGGGKSYALGETIIAGLLSYRAQVSLAVKDASGAPVARQTREASAIDAVAEIAAQKAIENAGYLAGAALVADLSQLESPAAAMLR